MPKFIVSAFERKKIKFNNSYEYDDICKDGDICNNIYKDGECTCMKSAIGIFYT